MYKRTTMETQADQAIAEFVTEIEEIFPELADTGLEEAIQATIQNSLDQAHGNGPERHV